MPDYLSKADLDNYGSDLVDFAQRAGAHAVSPQLDALAQQNAALASEIARERRARLDRQVADAIPNFREIDRDPEWHKWPVGANRCPGAFGNRS